VVVAVSIGISGIFPQAIDARRTPDAVTRLPVMSLSIPDARTKVVGAVASPSRRVTTTGQGTVLPPRPAPTPDAGPPEGASDEAVASAPQVAAPLAAAEVPEAQIKADALPAEAAPVPAARAAERTKFAEKAKPVVKKKVVHFAHRRSVHGDYAQYNAWGWPSSGWGGWGGGYEKGSNRISASRLQHLSQILQVPVPFFFEGAPASIGRPGAEESADAPSSSFVSDFLATSEGLDLVRAFTCIEDAKLRRAIVRLVEEIAPDAT